MTDPNPLVQTTVLESGGIWRVTFGAAKGNVLDALMRTNDASEGLHAFIEKRKPAWSNS